MLRRALIYLFVAGAAIAGGLAGYVYGTFTTASDVGGRGERALEVRRDLESIHQGLECTDLVDVGLKGPIQRDGLVFYVNVGHRDFQVIGFRVDANGPIVDWVGADLPECSL